MLSTNVRDTVELQPFKEQIVIPLWSVMVWLVLMNTSMFNIVLPTVIHDLQITAAQGSWIVTGYSLFLAISTVTMSRLSDFVPIRTLLIVGMTMFGIASLVGFLSTSYIVLLGARLVQALGSGASQALGIVMAARYIPLSRRGRAMASISLAASLAFGLGPIVGGVIAFQFGWHYLFILTGFVLFLLPIFYKHLPREKIETGKFDYIGCLLIALSATTFLLFLTTLHFLYLIIGSASALLTIRHIRKVQAPFIQPELLQNFGYLKIIFMGFAAFATHFAALFSLPLLLAEVYELQPMQIGFVIFPGALLSAALAIFVGRLIDRFGTTSTMIVGNGFLLLSSVLFSFLTGLGTIMIMFIYLFMSIGFFTVTTSLSNELTRILPEKQIGSGLGLQQLTTLFGVGFGVSIAGLFITKQQHSAPLVKYEYTFLFFVCFMIISCIMLFHYLFKKKSS